MSPKHKQLILACILYQAGGVGILVNCTNILLTAMTQDMMYPVHVLTNYFALRTLGAALSVGFMLLIHKRIGSRKQMLLNSILIIVVYFLVSLKPSIPVLYLIAVLTGVSISTIIIPIPMIINQWFHQKQSMILGIIFSASGIASALFNVVIPRIISGFGWEHAILLSCVIAGVLMIPSVLFAIYDRPTDRNTVTFGSSNENHALRSSNRLDPKGAPLIVSCIIISVLIVLTSIVNYLPKILLLRGFTFAFASQVASLCMLGNVFGKLCIGILFEKFGIYTSSIFCGVFLCIAIIMLSFTNHLSIFIGAFFFGFVFGLSVLLPPSMTLDVFVDAAYSKVIGFTSTVSSFASAAFAFASGIILTSTVNGNEIMFLSLILVLIYIAMLVLIRRLKDTTNPSNA